MARETSCNARIVKKISYKNNTKEYRVNAATINFEY
jgi:hypothetical protein